MITNNKLMAGLIIGGTVTLVAVSGTASYFWGKSQGKKSVENKEEKKEEKK